MRAKRKVTFLYFRAISTKGLLLAMKNELLSALFLLVISGTYNFFFKVVSFSVKSMYHE